MSSQFARPVIALAFCLAFYCSPVLGQDRPSLTLPEALERTGVSTDRPVGGDNPRVVGPQAEAEAAQALVGQARLRPNPEVALDVENFAGSGMFNGLNSTEYTLSVGQQLELGGKRAARVRAAEAEARTASLRSDLSLVELAFNVRERFVSAAAAEARVELAQDIVQRNEELARIARVLVKVGREPPLRALRAEAALAEASAALQSAQAESLAARTALASLWGAELTPPDVSSDFPDIEPPAAFMASSEYLGLRLALAESLAARAEIERERSLRVPDPVVSAGVRRFSESNDTAFLVGVSIPLPFRNRNQGNIAAAQARLRAANAREAIASSDYEQAVAQARALYLGAEARAETLSATSLPQAEEALRLVRIGYRAGRFPLIEVLSAAEARDTIREALIAAREDRGKAAAELIRLAAQ